MRKDQIKTTHGSPGMSLVELLVVVAILSIVMLAVMSLYIPAVQSTAAQTQLSDVQSNLRLAVNRMTRDLLTAGFLVSDPPVIFQASITPTTAENPDDDDFTIQTRAVSNAFARVVSSAPASGDIRMTVTNTGMVALFPVGSKVRVFEPVTASEIIVGTYTVTAATGSTIDIDPGGSGLTAAAVEQESVIIGVKGGAASIQTIRYRLNNGTLERIINGNTQFLARNMESVFFTYDFTPEGRVSRVDIVLTGITKAIKNDAISGAKSRQVNTSVSLRNVF